MRTFPGLVAVLVLTACGTSVQSLRSISDSTPDDAYSCMMRALADGAWQIQDTDRDSGFISATKSRGSTGTAIFSGAEFFTDLSITVFDADAGSEIRIVARPAKQDDGGPRSSAGLVLPESAQDEVHALAARCGQVQVETPPPGAS